MEKLVSIPEARVGDWSIEKFKVTAKDAELTAIRAAAQGSHEYVPEGEYTRLMYKNTVVMSDTPMELQTNHLFIQKATGHVLINGLGLGMVLKAILRKSNVLSVTVVEKNAEVIELVAGAFKDDPRVTIVQACAFEFVPPKGMQYDVVWHDIWYHISADNLPEMKKLHRKYGRRAGWQWSWCRDQCERMRSQHC